MFEGRLVEDEDVGERGDYEVDEGAGQPGFVRCRSGEGIGGTYHMMRKSEKNWR